MYVDTCQLAVCTPGDENLHISLWGCPERAGLHAKHAEIEFVPDTAEDVPPPGYRENRATGVNEICIWFRRWHCAHIMDILRNGRGVPCFCVGIREDGFAEYAGVKDWNLSTSHRTPSATENHELLSREQAAPGDLPRPGA